MNDVRSAQGGESGPRGRCKHPALRRGPSGAGRPRPRRARGRPRPPDPRWGAAPPRAASGAAAAGGAEGPASHAGPWRKGARSRVNFLVASAGGGGGCGSGLRPLAYPPPGASAFGWERLEPQLGAVRSARRRWEEDGLGRRASCEARGGGRWIANRDVARNRPPRTPPHGIFP